MKIFEQDGKINFVDDNNVFVGFDYTQCCCENFGYCITNEIPETEQHIPQDVDPDGYNFDTEFFRGGEEWAIFRLVKGGEPEIFLTLYNYHNGYYSHGFEASINGQPWTGGFL